MLALFPGALLSIVIYWKLVEPRRGQSEALVDEGEVDSFWTVLRTLSGSPAFRHISLATGLYTVLWLGVVNWLPSFFTRSFSMTLEQVGFWLALVLGISQIFGMLASGVMTDRLVRLADEFGLSPAAGPLLARLLDVEAGPETEALPPDELKRRTQQLQVDVLRNVATFGGMPGSCAAGLANLEIMEEEDLVLLTTLQEKGLRSMLLRK